LPDCTIYEYLFNNNKNNLNKVALIYFNKKITYKSLFYNIKRTASAFKAWGVNKGDYVSVCMPSTPEAIYIIYALNMIGAIPDLLDPRSNSESYKYFLNESKAKLSITIDTALSKFLEIKRYTKVNTLVSISPAQSLSFLKNYMYNRLNKIEKGDAISWKQFLNNKIVDNDINAVDNINTAVIVHTGGTTGIPKGVMLSNKAINSIAHQYRIMADYSKNQMLLDIIPPFASYGLCTSIHMPLSLGLSVTLIPKFNPDEFGDLIIKYRPNYVMGVPSFWLSLLSNEKYDNYDLSFLSCAACGGDSISSQSEKTLNDFFASHKADILLDKGYVMSEMSATAVSCYGSVNKLGSVGIPMALNNLCIIDTETGKELPYDNEGEICITEPGMMLGYFNNDELTQQTIKRHPDGYSWIHTGDLGHIDKDGFLYHDGRIKRMFVRYDGFKIYPDSVEKTILTNSEIESCVVVGCNRVGLGIVPIAFIVLKSNVGINKEIIIKSIKDLCKSNLAERAIPAKIIPINQMPTTNLGKIDYRALEKMAEGMEYGNE